MANTPVPSFALEQIKPEALPTSSSTHHYPEACPALPCLAPRQATRPREHSRVSVSQSLSQPAIAHPHPRAPAHAASHRRLCVCTCCAALHCTARHAQCRPKTRMACRPLLALSISTAPTTPILVTAGTRGATTMPTTSWTTLSALGSASGPSPSRRLSRLYIPHPSCTLSYALFSSPVVGLSLPFLSSPSPSPSRSPH